MERVCDVEVLLYPVKSTLQLRGTPLLFPSSYRFIATENAPYLRGYHDGWDANGFDFQVWLDQWVDFTIDRVSALENPEMAKARQAKAFAEGIVVMPVLCHIALYHLDGFTREATIACIVLQPQTGSERGVYRRLGIAHVSKTGSDGLDLEEIKSQFDALRTPLQAHLFQKEDDDSKYTIAVI